MRTLKIQKLWITEAEIEVEDDATQDEIIDKLDDIANDKPAWDGTIVFENDIEIWSV